MADATVKCNLIHYGSNLCQRVVRSVLDAEIHGLVLGFDYAVVIQHLISRLLGKSIEREAFVDSKTLFKVVAKDRSTSEKRLMIDISALKQSYESGELSRLGWIMGVENPADGLTKPMLSTTFPLWTIMRSNIVHIKPIGWADNSRK